jgi:hypothetical protein
MVVPMRKAKQDVVKKKLERVFRYLEGAGPASRDRRTYDFVFHMTDWQEDLEKLSRVYRKPDEATDAKWREAVEGFLYHVIGHLLAAADLNGYVPDPFNIISKPKRKRRSRKAAGK